jgi:hypothetical protein
LYTAFNLIKPCVGPVCRHEDATSFVRWSRSTIAELSILFVETWNRRVSSAFLLISRQVTTAGPSSSLQKRTSARTFLFSSAAYISQVHCRFQPFPNFSKLFQVLNFSKLFQVLHR